MHYCTCRSVIFIHFILLFHKTVISVSSSITSKGITCYTCPNGAENNEICNQKAVDLPCPPNLPFCLNQNYINNISQKTILVAKTCSVQDHCSQGCQYVNHTTKVCKSCCSTSYCNKFLVSTATAKYSRINWIILFISQFIINNFT